MKRITTLLATIILCSLSFSQTNKLLESVTKNYLTGKVEAAKQEMDKILGNPSSASDPEVLIYDLSINAEIIKDSLLSKKYPNIKNAWLDKFKTYEKFDQEYIQISSPSINWKPLGIMYEKYLNDGFKLFNEQKWEEAFESFEQSTYLSKIIMKKDLKKDGGAFDTIPFLMSGFSAQNSKKIDKAVFYYSLLIDKGYGGPNTLDICKYLLIEYIELKDKAGFDKYLALTKEKYPKENFDDFELEFINKNMNIDEKINYYNVEDGKGTLSAFAYTNFGDAFVSYKKGDLDSAKNKLVHVKAIDAYQKAFNKNNNPLTAYNAGILLYKNFTDLDDLYRENVRTMQSINSNKPVEKDPKKRAVADAKVKEQIEPIKKANADLEVKILAAADESVIWLKKAEKALHEKAEKTKIELTSFKNTVKTLGQLYEYKRDKAKGKDPKDYDKFDAESKYYFGIFDKL